MRLVLPSLIVLSLAPVLPAQQCGDCDGNGQVTILDALAAAQHAAGLIVLVSPAFELCNVQGTLGGPPAGSVDVLDALTLAQFAAGLITVLSCTSPPSCGVTTPSPGAPSGTVLVSYEAIDALSLPVALVAEHSTDAGATWAPSTEGAGGDGTMALSTSPLPGDAHLYSWDTVADGLGGGGPQSVLLRLTVSHLGGAASCATGAFTVDNAGQWTLVTASAAWAGRRDHTSVVFDGKMWVIGGFYHIGITGLFYLNDVWWSDDGASWTEATPAAPWEPRFDHASVVFDGKMWVIGGSYDDGSGLAYPRNDVWWSDDGVSWTQAMAAAPWGERGAMGCVVHDSKMWVLAGAHQFSAYNDVWWSTDGATWTRATAAAPWTPVVGHGCTGHNGEIVHMGGIALAGITEDLWTSTDGSSWSMLTPTVPWGPRYDYTTFSHAGLLWVLGGHLDGAAGDENDAWTSTDGITWNQVTAAAPWATRKDHTSVVFDSRVWVLGGHTGATHYNDVWSTP